MLGFMSNTLCAWTHVDHVYLKIYLFFSSTLATKVQIPLRGSHVVFSAFDIKKNHKTFSRWIQFPNHRTGIELINKVLSSIQTRWRA